MYTCINITLICLSVSKWRQFIVMNRIFFGQKEVFVLLLGVGSVYLKYILLENLSRHAAENLLIYTDLVALHMGMTF